MAFPGVETFVDNKIGIIKFHDFQLAVTRLCFDDGIKRVLILGDSITDGLKLLRIEVRVILPVYKRVLYARTLSFPAEKNPDSALLNLHPTPDFPCRGLYAAARFITPVKRSWHPAHDGKGVRVGIKLFAVDQDFGPCTSRGILGPNGIATQGLNAVENFPR